MLACIHAVKLTVMDSHIVDVTGSRQELNHLDDLRRFSVVFDQTRSLTLIAGSTFLLMSGHLPDKAVIPGNAMQSSSKFRGPRGGEHVIDFPGPGIDANQRVKAVRL